MCVEAFEYFQQQMMLSYGHRDKRITEKID